MARKTLHTIIPLVLLVIALWGVVDEIQYRSEATRTFATVRQWQSKRLGGFKGLAIADVDAQGMENFYKDRPIRTNLWYRPSPGERIPVYYQLGSAPGRVDSLAQGFVLLAVLALIGVGWLAETWWPRRPRLSPRGPEVEGN
jgi:hypothetical protein